jgi:hypothetical protein
LSINAEFGIEKKDFGKIFKIVLLYVHVLHQVEDEIHFLLD